MAIGTLGWDDFRVVLAIADTGGLIGATVPTGLNHSTLFRRLARIEAAVGSTLFERHRSGYVATPAGEAMVAVARRLDDDVAAFARRVAGQEPAPAGELRVTTNDLLLVHLLTPILARFRHSCPDVTLDIVLTNQALNLSRRDADVAIRASQGPPPDTLVGKRLARIAWALYGRIGDGLEGAVWVSLADDHGAQATARHVRKHVPEARVVYRSNTVLGLAEAVEAGIGIGYLPCLVGDRRPGLARLAEPEPALAADLWLLTHPDLRHSPRVRAFLDFTAAALARERDAVEGRLPGASG